LLREKVRFFQRFCLVLDLCWVSLSWLGAYWLRFLSGWIPVYFGTPPIEVYLAHLPVVLLVWLVALLNSGVYRANKWWSLNREWGGLLRGSVVAMVLLVCVTYFSTKAEISRIFYFCFGCICFCSLLLNRLLIRTILRRLIPGGGDLQRILLVGENSFARIFEQNVRRHPEVGLSIRGMLLPQESSHGSRKIPVLGRYTDLRQVLLQEKIDNVIFALTMEETGQLQSLLCAIQDLPVDVQVIPDVFSIMPLRPGVEDFGGVPLVQIRTSPHLGPSRLAKRTLDIVFSLASLLLLSPVMSLIALLIKLTSPGPSFYRQIRMGFDGKEFCMLKFRTMHVGAEPESRAVWSQRLDPRRTRLGVFLRKYSLDEIPQLWNVLKGEMSLVGPRPERPEFIQEFCKRVPFYMLRYKVKSGLTGLAQVQGWRGATSLEKRIECDIQYIQRWTMSLDLKILWRTIWKGFINRAEG